jgi:hypothetical protein
MTASDLTKTFVFIAIPIKAVFTSHIRDKLHQAQRKCNRFYLIICVKHEAVVNGMAFDNVAVVAAHQHDRAAGWTGGLPVWSPTGHACR